MRSSASRAQEERAQGGVGESSGDEGSASDGDGMTMALQQVSGGQHNTVNITQHEPHPHASSSIQYFAQLHSVLASPRRQTPDHLTALPQTAGVPLRHQLACSLCMRTHMHRTEAVSCCAVLSCAPTLCAPVHVLQASPRLLKFTTTVLQLPTPALVPQVPLGSVRASLGWMSTFEGEDWRRCNWEP